MKITCTQIIVIIIIILAIIWIITWLVMRNSKNVAPNVEPYSPQLPSGNFKLYYFYHPSCGYCKQFKPVWDKLSQLYQSMGSNITQMVDVTQPENENLTFYYSINKYPTIILSSKNKNLEYTGNRSFENINNFVLSNTKN